MRVVGTAGHVDHGKSTLVEALTGTDPDRFAEEKERGLTIDLGFATTTLPSGEGIAFVDVPGHVRFLKNMLAGAGAVDATLFVVAATEGWKPQSEEHLRILGLLGIRHGVIALTKVALAGTDATELARLDVADRVGGTFLEGAEVVEVDAPAGRGIDVLRGALDRLVVRTPAAADRGRARLWVDRSFAAKGSGTVATGTLAGGALTVDDEVELWPGRRRARVRGLQSHQQHVRTIGPGHRVAVNLTGVPHHDVERGMAIVHPGQWEPTTVLDASLDVLPALDHDVSRRGAYAAHIGSGEHAVRVRVLGHEAIGPGASGFVRLHLPLPVPLLPGDRYVLREHGRGETVGGGEVLDVAPVLPASRARPDRSWARVVAERGWVDADLLGRLTGEVVGPNLGGWVVDASVLAAERDRLATLVERAGAAGVELVTLTDRERAVVEALPGVVVERGVARAVSAAADDLASDPWLAALRAAPFSPPAPTDRAVARKLVERGLAVEADGIWFAAEAVDAAGRVVAGLLAASPAGVTMAAIREALGTSRKFALPLVGHLDASGITRRRGDLRIAGPRLPS